MIQINWLLNKLQKEYKSIDPNVIQKILEKRLPLLPKQLIFNIIIDL